MRVRSRTPWRPTLPEACSSFSTSAGVRYSRVRRSRLNCLRGGIAGEGARGDLGAEGLLLRPREVTFPFTGIGADFAVADFLGTLAMRGHHTFPLRAEDGNVRKRSGDYL
jgi:hypothetical protein